MLHGPIPSPMVDSNPHVSSSLKGVVSEKEIIWLAIGFLVDNITAGIFIGLGGGFLTMLILRIKLGEW